MDFNYGDITDKVTNCCDEISDPTPIHIASRIARIMIRSKQDRSWNRDLEIVSWREISDPIIFHSDRIVSGIGPRTSTGTGLTTNLDSTYLQWLMTANTFSLSIQHHSRWSWHFGCWLPNLLEKYFHITTDKHTISQHSILLNQTTSIPQLQIATCLSEQLKWILILSSHWRVD